MRLCGRYEKSAAVSDRDLVFTVPRDDVEIDFVALSAAVPKATVHKRIFIDFLLVEIADRVPPEQVLARAQVELTAGDPFDDVAWHDYFAVLLTVAELLAGPERPAAAGLREIGRSTYRRLLELPVGRLLLGRQLSDALRVAGELWEEFNSIGRVRAEARGERAYDYHFDPYPAALTETIGVGVFEGMFRYHHMAGDIGLARLGPTQTIMRLTW